MMAQPAFPPGMAPGHPGMGGPGHPMAGMQHPGGHMGGHPGPGMMQGMHPGVSGPQVTQGPMVSGMPQGPGTPAPGHMPGNSMAMAHLGPQQHMFQQQNPQMNFGGGMPTQQTAMQQQAVMRQRMLAQMQAQSQQGIPMNMVNNPNFNQAQMAQMKMNMPIQQQMQHMQQNPNMQGFRNQQQHQQQLMAAHAAQAHQAAIAQHRAQQMQLSRSQEQQQQAQAQAQAQAQQQGTPQQAQQAQTSQAPQSHPTPVAPSQPQSQPTPQPQPTPIQTPVSQSKPQPPQQQAVAAANQQTPQPQPPQNQPTPQVKQSEGDEETQIKQDQAGALLMQDIPKEQIINGQCILQLILFQDSLACPAKPQDLDWWQDIIMKYFSPLAQMKMQLFNSSNASDKSFLLQFASLARFYHAHYVGGIKQILLSSYDHVQKKQQTGETFVQSTAASLTYVFHNDIRVSTTGSLQVLFDDFNKIVRFDIMTGGWQEYIPRPMAAAAMQASRSPTQNSKQSPKMNKNVKKLQQQGQSDAPLVAPSSGVNEWGITPHVLQFLEVAEVLTSMAPLIEYFHQHPGMGVHESLQRINQENSQNLANANANRAMQNQMARAANGQIQFPNQAMNGPNQFASPSMAHLGLPQNQGSPHLGGPVHTPSPAQNAQGAVPMMHQMSAQGSNLSSSQGPSTNTSPNVSNKRRRPSTVKAEDDNGSANTDGNQNKVKPSPRIGGKRQKAT